MPQREAAVMATGIVATTMSQASRWVEVVTSRSTMLVSRPTTMATQSRQKKTISASAAAT